MIDVQSKASDKKCVQVYAFPNALLFILKREHSHPSTSSHRLKFRNINTRLTNCALFVTLYNIGLMYRHDVFMYMWMRAYMCVCELIKAIKLDEKSILVRFRLD